MAIFNTVYGGEWSWKPWANTVAYYPLTSTSTVNDMSWNWLTLTNNWNVLFWTYHWVDCANYSGNWSLRNSVLTTWYIWQTFTISEWVLRHWNEILIWTFNNVGTKRAIWINVASTFINFTFGTWSAFQDNKYSINTVTDQWYHIALTHNSTGNLIWYVNWQQVITWNVTIWEWASNFWIWAAVFSDNEIYYSNWNISNVIIEDIPRTAQEISKYYNQTKSLYWL